MYAFTITNTITFWPELNYLLPKELFVFLHSRQAQPFSLMYPTRAICLVGVLVWSAWDHVQSTHARTVAGIEINLESFDHRNIRSNFTICQKVQGSFISFLTKVLNSVGWIWSIIFSNECWHLIHVLLLTVYGTYSKNYMHFEKLYSCYGTATLTKRSQIEANHQSTQNITSHPSEENYIIVKVVTCF